MTSNRHKRKGRPDAAEVIRREAGNRANRRLMRKLPLFAVSDELPERFRNLLDRLDETENRAS